MFYLFFKLDKKLKNFINNIRFKKKQYLHINFQRFVCCRSDGQQRGESILQTGDLFSVSTRFNQ